MTPWNEKINSVKSAINIKEAQLKSIQEKIGSRDGSLEELSHKLKEEEALNKQRVVLSIMRLVKFVA